MGTVMRASGGLHLDYVSLAEYQTARWDDVLGVATFHGAPARSCGMDSSGIPVARINTPVLTDEPNMYEVWRCGEAAESGQQGRGRDVAAESVVVAFKRSSRRNQSNSIKQIAVVAAIGLRVLQMADHDVDQL